jgi:hypothetical protein
MVVANMMVIEKMKDATYDAVCAVGAEFVKELVLLLKSLELGMDNAPAIVAVAAAGITKGFNIDPEQFAQMVAKAQHMWRLDGDGSVNFDPPHLRPDYVAPAPALVSAGN